MFHQSPRLSKSPFLLDCFRRLENRVLSHFRSRLVAKSINLHVTNRTLHDCARMRLSFIANGISLARSLHSRGRNPALDDKIRISCNILYGSVSNCAIDHAISVNLPTANNLLSQILASMNLKHNSHLFSERFRNFQNIRGKNKGTGDVRTL